MSKVIKIHFYCNKCKREMGAINTSKETLEQDLLMADKYTRDICFDCYQKQMDEEYEKLPQKEKDEIQKEVENIKDKINAKIDRALSLDFEKEDPKKPCTNIFDDINEMIEKGIKDREEKRKKELQDAALKSLGVKVNIHKEVKSPIDLFAETYKDRAKEIERKISQDKARSREGVNPKQFREFAINIGSKPDYSSDSDKRIKEQIERMLNLINDVMFY